MVLWDRILKNTNQATRMLECKIIGNINNFSVHKINKLKFCKSFFFAVKMWHKVLNRRFGEYMNILDTYNRNV